MKDSALTKAEASALDAALATSRKRGIERTFIQLLDYWDRTVAEIEAGWDGLLDEYVNAVTARGSLEGVLAAITPALRAKVERLIEPIDERFRRATRPTAHDLYGETTWWWRLPHRIQGELEEDMRGQGLDPDK